MDTARQWAHSAWLHARSLWHDVTQDPGRVDLRRAARAALVMPATFAFAQVVIGNAQLTTFVALGCFALLVMADYGGLRGPRALAYAATTGIGAVLIALGTLASASPWQGALAMLLVGFAVTFAGVFGGYAAAGRAALLFPFVLAVSIPATPAALPPRLAGWLIAGVVASLAAVFLWPRFERFTLRQQAASACRALATLIQAQRSRPASVESLDGAEAAEAEQAEGRVRQATTAAVAAVFAARQAYAAAAKRPSDPARRDRAFVELLSELERLVEYATRSPPWQSCLPARHPRLREGDRLATAAVQTLMASAAVLTGSGPSPDLPTLLGAWRTHRAALDQWAAEALRAGAAPEDVLDGLQADETLRVMAYLTLAVGSNAAIAAGARVGASVEVPPDDLPTEVPLRAGAIGFLQRVGETIRTQLAPTSSVLHKSLRAALGLASAVLLAQLLQLEHAFWVVLGTLSGLRSNALATGRTTLQALLGTLLGVAFGAAFLVVVGTHATVLRVALPLAVFLAAYAATAVGVVAGQAAFTILVLILFNLIAPVGWQLVVVRLEDVAVGVGVSAVVGVLLWPRGTWGELRASLADLYRAVAASLSEAFGRVLTPGTTADAGTSTGGGTAAEAAGLSGQAQGQRRDRAHGGTRDRIRAAFARAGEALDQYLHERGAQPLAPEDAGLLVAAGADAMLAAGPLERLADMGYQVQAYAVDSGDSAEVTAIIGQVRTLVAAYARLADQLEGGAADAANATECRDHLDRQQAISPVVSQAAVRAAALSGLRRWRQDPDAGRQTIAVVTAGEWVEYLGALAAKLEKPVVEVATAERLPSRWSS
jgi:uncharacterized membrane protein YccC